MNDPIYMQTKKNNLAGERTQTVEVMSCKRETTMADGRVVFFNKTRTRFFEFISELPKTFWTVANRGFAPSVNAVEIFPTPEEKEAIFQTRRAGRAQWLKEHNFFPA